MVGRNVAVRRPGDIDHALEQRQRRTLRLIKWIKVDHPPPALEYRSVSLARHDRANFDRTARLLRSRGEIQGMKALDILIERVRRVGCLFGLADNVKCV